MKLGAIVEIRPELGSRAPLYTNLLLDRGVDRNRDSDRRRRFGPENAMQSTRR